VYDDKVHVIFKCAAWNDDDYDVLAGGAVVGGHTRSGGFDCAGANPATILNERYSTSRESKRPDPPLWRRAGTCHTHRAFDGAHDHLDSYQTHGLPCGSVHPSTRRVNNGLHRHMAAPPRFNSFAASFPTTMRTASRS
jgi:hypothetical protein